MTIPYASASTGAAARDEITKVLRRFGCESVGFMDDFDKHEVLLAFTHRGRPVQLRASAKGWAQMFLKENPYTHRRRGTRGRDGGVRQELAAEMSKARRTYLPRIVGDKVTGGPTPRSIITTAGHVVFTCGLIRCTNYKGTSRFLQTTTSKRVSPGV